MCLFTYCHGVFRKNKFDNTIQFFRSSIVDIKKLQEAGTKLKNLRNRGKVFINFGYMENLAHLAILAFAINKNLEGFTSCR